METQWAFRVDVQSGRDRLYKENIVEWVIVYRLVIQTNTFAIAIIGSVSSMWSLSAAMKLGLLSATLMWITRSNPITHL